MYNLQNKDVFEFLKKGLLLQESLKWIASKEGACNNCTIQKCNTHYCPAMANIEKQQELIIQRNLEEIKSALNYSVPYSAFEVYHSCISGGAMGKHSINIKTTIGVKK